MKHGDKQWKQLDELLDRLYDAAGEQRSAVLSQLAADQPALASAAHQALKGDGLEKLEPGAALAALPDSAEEVSVDLVTVGELGRYTIWDRLGTGGTGVVYLAEDTGLRRKVALKVLDEAFATDQHQLQRLRQEAETLASLDHPNIVTVYSIEELEDITFITMTWVDGSTLGDLIPPTGMNVDQLLARGGQVADALAAAHERGVVHRDLKPGNVMVTPGGRTYVLDFGLAKSNIAAPQTASGGVITGEGIILGTVPYMSPEQARAQSVDTRSDIFSFGALLYEMASGQRLFRAATAADLISSILHDPVPSIRERRPDLPLEFDELLARCLSQEPGGRPSASEISRQLLGLRQPGRPSVSASQRSIAVLPFADMSPHGDQQYFCDGTAEEILNALSRVRRLRIAARTSSFRFRAAEGDAREIGRSLAVESILEGSVRKAGDRVRVTAQLISTHDGYRMWSGRYDRELTDVFAIQDDIAENIVDALKLVLTTEEQNSLVANHGVGIEAYEYYLRGRHLLNQGTAASAGEGLEMFRRATAIDSGFVAAQAGIAEAHGMLYHWAGRRGADLADAERASRKALEKAPESATAHAARGHALSLAGRRDEAQRCFKRAMQLNPELYEAYYYGGIDRIHAGELSAAVPMLKMAADIRRHDCNALDHLRMVYCGLGGADEAVAVSGRLLRRAREALAINPSESRVLQLGALALACLGRPVEGHEWLERALALTPDDPRAWYNAAGFYSQAGEIDKALGYLEQAVEARFALTEWVNQDSDLDPIRQTARFREVCSQGREGKACSEDG